MKIQYPITFPDGYKYASKTKPRFRKKDMIEALNEMRKEIKATGIFGTLITNVDMNPSGQRRGAEIAVTAAQIEFKSGGKRYNFYCDKYFRTADNIWALSQALKHWRKFREEKIFVQTENL